MWYKWLLVRPQVLCACALACDDLFALYISGVGTEHHLQTGSATVSIVARLQQGSFPRRLNFRPLKSLPLPSRPTPKELSSLNAQQHLRRSRGQGHCQAAELPEHLLELLRHTRSLERLRQDLDSRY